MLREFHLSDEDILLVADGEVSRRREREARAHLAACWLCRSRLADLESAIADFITLHRSTLDPRLPAESGPSALLKARLAQVAQPSPGPWQRWLEFLAQARTAATICALLLAGLLTGVLLLRQSRLRPPMLEGRTGEELAATAPEDTLIPDHLLTPGAVRPVALSDVCSRPHEEVVKDVPNSLRQEVFNEYGIVDPHPQDYEIDYLIAPGLGGTDDIHNLWPEPSTSSAWNAHVKDALEERLHSMVCDGRLDLATAQQAIANDWITAYKKYLGQPASLSPFSSGMSYSRVPHPARSSRRVG
jgi:hypothetical protein